MLRKTVVILILLLVPAVFVSTADNTDRPTVPSLDDRLARFDSPSAIFTVTTTADAGPGSFRAAITSSNATPGPDFIGFAIPGAGPHTITPLSPLPPLADPAGVIIDGLTQTGSNCTGIPATTILMIELDGSLAGATVGLYVGSDFNVIIGLIINSFEKDGILIEAGVINISAISNTIACCFIGTDPSGTIDLGNGTNLATLYGGIRIKNVSGGVAIDNLIIDCLISGNYAEGVAIWGPIVPGDVAFNTVTTCYIGTDASGAVDLGNDHEGVNLTEGTHDNFVSFNLISGNDFDGVGIQGFDNIGFGSPIQTFANIIEGNMIGLDINGLPLPNSMYGVTIGTYGTTTWGCADFNTVRRNTIAHNRLAGVYVWEHSVNTFNTDGNRITENSIYENGGLGIDLQVLGVTGNDPGDPDNLGNQEMNFPVIVSAIESGGTTTIKGTLDTPVPNLSLVEVFKARLDPSGHGEGEIYLGTTQPNAVGDWSLSTGLLAVGDSVTTTATSSFLNTSEFSRTVKVKCCVLRGDVNHILPIDISDLTYLVAFMFGGGPPPPCIDEGDINALPPIDISDLTYLVAFMFGGGPPPPPC